MIFKCKNPKLSFKIRAIPFLQDLSGAAESPLEGGFPADLMIDPDGSKMTYTATLSNGLLVAVGCRGKGQWYGSKGSSPLQESTIFPYQRKHAFIYLCDILCILKKQTGHHELYTRIYDIIQCIHLYILIRTYMHLQTHINMKQMVLCSSHKTVSPKRNMILR